MVVGVGPRETVYKEATEEIDRLREEQYIEEYSNQRIRGFLIADRLGKSQSTKVKQTRRPS